MKYISCFSGIGGLEGTSAPVQVCELDQDCRTVLSRKFPDAAIHDDIRTFRPSQVDVVAGGWPCQDISVAGNQAGLMGSRSSLLYELLRVSRECQAKTLIAENVSNLLRMNGGNEFHSSLAAIHEAGFPFISWRVFNARDFGLPQHRTRLILVGSKTREVSNSLFRDVPQNLDMAVDVAKSTRAAGFYWTAGTHSINYSRGYTPTVKVGSSLSIPSPPAIHYGDIVRLLSPSEALRLQGFTLDPFEGIAASSVYRMAGNAVARPLGKWVFDGVANGLQPERLPTSPGDHRWLIPSCASYLSVGMSIDGVAESYPPPATVRGAVNLIDFIEQDSEQRLSPRAAQGLLRRLSKSGQVVPLELRSVLEAVSTAMGGICD